LPRSESDGARAATGDVFRNAFGDLPADDDG
jgi:hypothetical protein